MSDGGEDLYVGFWDHPSIVSSRVDTEEPETWWATDSEGFIWKLYRSQPVPAAGLKGGCWWVSQYDPGAIDLADASSDSLDETLIRSASYGTRALLLSLPDHVRAEFRPIVVAVDGAES